MSKQAAASFSICTNLEHICNCTYFIFSVFVFVFVFVFAIVLSTSFNSTTSTCTISKWKHSKLQVASLLCPDDELYTSFTLCSCALCMHCVKEILGCVHCLLHQGLAIGQLTNVCICLFVFLKLYFYFCQIHKNSGLGAVFTPLLGPGQLCPVRGKYLWLH